LIQEIYSIISKNKIKEKNKTKQQNQSFEFLCLLHVIIILLKMHVIKTSWNFDILTDQYIFCSFFL